MITKDSPLKDFINLVTPQIPCGSAVEYMLGLPLERDMKSTTETYLNDKTIPAQYALWVLLLFYTEIDETLRSLFIKKIHNGENAKKLIELLDKKLTKESKDQLMIMAYGHT